MSQGTIIFLNGTSSAGKTVTAKALQECMDGYYLHTGIDHFLERIPDKFHTLSNGTGPVEAEGLAWVSSEHSERLTDVQIGPAGFCLWSGMYGAIAAFSEAGVDQIVDDVIFEPSILREAVRVLSPFKPLFVGLRCPLEIAEQREQERGDRLKGLVGALYERVHSHGVYDLEIDTSISTPEETANQIKDRIENGPEPDAFARLRLHEKEA